MNCQQALEMLEPALENDLQPESAVAFRRHVEECPGCAGEYSRAMEFIATLEGVAAPEPPAALADRVRNAVRVEADRMSATRKMSWSLGFGIPAVLAAFIYFFFPGGFAGFLSETSLQISSLWSAVADFASGGGKEGLVGKFSASMPAPLAQHAELTLGVVTALSLMLVIALVRYVRVASPSRSR